MVKIKPISFNKSKSLDIPREGVGFWIFFLLIFFFGMATLNFIFDSAIELDSSDSNITETILANVNSSQTLQGVATNLVSIRNNESWLSFDGVNDIVTMPRNNMAGNITNQTSISVWFNMNEITSPSLTPRIVYLGSSDAGNEGVDILYSNSSQIIRFKVSNGTDTEQATIPYTKTNFTQWINVIGTFNGSNLIIYADGVNISQSNFNEPIANFDFGTRFLLGAFSEPITDSGYSGAMDEVRIYNQSLSASEVLEIFNSGRQANASLPSDGLVVWYSFNEGTGTILFDKSGNGNNGE